MFVLESRCYIPRQLLLVVVLSIRSDYARNFKLLDHFTLFAKLYTHIQWIYVYRIAVCGYGYGCEISCPRQPWSLAYRTVGAKMTNDLCRYEKSIALQVIQNMRVHGSNQSNANAAHIEDEE